MKRSKTKLEKRKEFVKLAINHPEKAAEKLRGQARGLANCKKTSDVIYALSEIFFAFCIPSFSQQRPICNKDFARIERSA